MRDFISRDEWDAMRPITTKAMIEIASCAIQLTSLKWWQFGRRKRIMARIELVRSCYALKPLTFLTFQP